MRKLKLFFACLLMAVLSIGQMWAADQVYNGTVAKVDANGDQTMNGVVWTITSDNTAGLGQAVNATKGAQIGSGSKPTKSLTFETMGISGTIKQVVVNTSGASGFSGTVSVTVGSTAFLCNSASTASLTTSAADYTFTGEASGKITISWSQTTSKAIYVKTISVTYGESSPSCTSDITITKADNPANGTFTIDNSGTVCIDEGNAIVNVTATPVAHYHLASVTSTVGTVGTISNNTCAITNIDASTTVSATFAEDDKVKVTWNVNGDETLKTDVYVGDKPVFPATPDACDATSTTFIGWATEPWTDKLADLTGKTVYTSASSMPAVDAAVTYYAVFAKAGGSASNLFSWAGGGKTDLLAIEGIVSSSLDNDYAASHNPYLVKWNSDGKYLIIPVSAQPGKVSASFKMIGGATTSTVDVMESTATDGEFTTVETLTISGSSNDVVDLETTQTFKSTTRAIKLLYHKGSNVGVGPISIEGAVSMSDYMTTCSTPTVVKPTISGETSFWSSTEVTLTQAEADAIYYTINGDEPTTSSTPYSAPFIVDADGTTTVKAIAIKGGVSSAVSEETFTKIDAKTTMAEVQAAATSTTDQSINVSISNWVVTAVSGSQVWFTDADNTKGILLYKSGHGFTVGKKLNGNVLGTKVKLYNLYPELTSLLASEVTVTNAEAVSPRTTTIAALTSGHPAEQGTIVKLEGVTFESSALSDGVNSIAADNKFFSSLALVEGTTYDITGVVTYYKNGDDAIVKIAPRSADDVEAKSSVVIPTAANLAALKAVERGTYILTLNNAVISYVNGKNAFIEDETGGALIFFQDHGFIAGNCLNGDYQVVTTDYQGKFEITAVEPQAGAETTTAAIPLTTVTITALNANFSSYESRRVKIVGANVTDAISGSDRNGAINDGAALAVYAAAGASTITLTADDNVDIIGYPGFHNTDQQLNVWTMADITVNEKDPAGIAFTPESATHTPGVDEWSAPAFANPNTLDVTFSSDAEGVATVSNVGVVSLAGGYGTAVITAHTNGDATHNAGNATYTITVIDPSTVDTRHVANGPAAFTTTSGNLTPADIAYTAYQGGASTAPGIYNDGIRLYQISGSNDFGGFVTLTAKAGCTIDEVQITTTSKYATTVAYSKDGNETLLGSESVAKSGSYTTGTGLNVSSVNILNLGTGSDGRLEIASITVYYTGEALTIDHYELGGTYQTAFMQDDEFNHTGLIVYAAYDELGENKVDITASCTFSDPDMSTTGAKTIEITYDEAVIKTYEINVAADSRKVAESPATFTTVSGDMTPNDITFASYQGEAGTAPANYNDGIRLYQAPSADKIGGYITLKAKKGCTIDQVKITTTNSYATTVAYSVDGNENLLGSESVAKSSDYSTPSGLNVESVNILNLGTGSNGRLEIASIKVWYTGDALAVHHYILGGTYETVFEQFGTFNYDGLTVTAAYDELETITEAVTGFTVEADLSAAGAKKANVMLNSVKIAEYDITVTASAKEDPALAYSPASVILTLGDALSAPTLSNDFSVAVSYESDNEAVATVDAEGNIALAGGVGTAVITASFAGNDDYLASEATFTITINAPAEDLSGTWVVATSIAAGDRIIIADVAEAGVVYTMGEQANNGTGNNRVAVESAVDEYGVLTPTAGTKTFLVVDVENGEFALQALNGNYLYAASNSSNHLKETSDVTNVNAKWTITIENGVATIKALHEGHTPRNWMRKNESSAIFSCYGSGQNDIVIYKIGTPDYGSYQRDVTNGNYGTICLPKAGTIEGAKLFDFEYYDGANTLYLLEVNGNAMEAGHPYIFQATADQLNVTYTSGNQVEAGDVNGLYGFYDLNNMATDAAAHFDIPEDAGNYILYSNQYWLVSGRAAYINNFRAYFKMTEVPTEPATPQVGNAPRRRVAMTVNGAQTATGMDELNASEAPVKMIIDGQLFIIRGEQMFNANGQLVK